MNGTAQKRFARNFLRATREMLLDQSWPRLRTCVEALSDEQVWWRPNASSNSIGNLGHEVDGDYLGPMLVGMDQVARVYNLSTHFHGDVNLDQTHVGVRHQDGTGEEVEP